MSKLIRDLERIRRDSDLTQAEMAERLGITESYYSMVVNGKRDGGKAFLVGVIRAFPHLADSLRQPA